MNAIGHFVDVIFTEWLVRSQHRNTQGDKYTGTKHYQRVLR